MAKNLHQHKHSKLRAAGVDLACFVAGLAALLVGYYVAGWPGAAVAAGLAVAIILRAARRPGGPGVGAMFVTVMVSLLIIAFGYRIVGWPAVILVPVIAAIGLRDRELGPYSSADYERAAELRNEMFDDDDTTSPWSPLNPDNHFLLDSSNSDSSNWNWDSSNWGSSLNDT